MLDRPGLLPEEIIRETTEAWLAAFEAALRAQSVAELSPLFVADSHWRNLFGLSWQFATVSGNATVVAEFLARSAEAGARAFPHRHGAAGAARGEVGGRDVVEAIFAFETVNGPGYGAVRLLREADGAARAWTISTSLDFDAVCAAREAAAATSHVRDFAGPDWLEQRRAAASYDGRDPDVLIVGGGHAGISVAVEARRIGLTALVVDRMARIGDNWRLRYRGLKLHNKTPVNHLRYLPFPSTFPEYIPKDKIANWLESYVDIMEVDFWTRTAFDGAEYDEAAQRWTARLTREGAARTLRPETHRARDQRQRHAEHSRHRRHREFQGRGAALQPLQGGQAMEGPARDRVRHRHQRARHLPGAAGRGRRRHHGAAQPDHGRQCRAGAAL